MLAKFPCPTTLGIDQRVINCCADATRDGAEARNLIIATKTDTRGGNCTCIEATAVALDVSPMSVGLDSENGPLDLPISSNLAPEKPAADRDRSLGRASRRQFQGFASGPRPQPLSLLIPTVIFVPQPVPPPIRDKCRSS